MKWFTLRMLASVGLAVLLSGLGTAAEPAPEDEDRLAGDKKEERLSPIMLPPNTKTDSPTTAPKTASRPARPTSAGQTTGGTNPGQAGQSQGNSSTTPQPSSPLPVIKKHELTEAHERHERHEWREPQEERERLARLLRERHERHEQHEKQQAPITWKPKDKTSPASAATSSAGTSLSGQTATSSTGTGQNTAQPHQGQQGSPAAHHHRPHRKPGRQHGHTGPRPMTRSR
jgi:hypothetical protein